MKLSTSIAATVWIAAALAGCGSSAEITASGDETAETSKPVRPTDEASPASGAGAPSNAATESHIAAWEAPDYYRFDLASSCGERSLLGAFRLTVEDGVISRLEPLDDQAQRIVQDPELREDVPTLTGLLDQARIAQDQGADVVEVIADPPDGRPTAINIDWNLNATDDEACYAVSNYTTDQ